MLLVLALFLAALIFEYINGFLDTANSIATVVATRVLTPRQAVLMSAVFNLGGALVGTASATGPKSATGTSGAPEITPAR